MKLGLLQRISLRDGQRVAVVGFDVDHDGGKLVKVGWTNDMGEYFDKLVKYEDIIISQE